MSQLPVHAAVVPILDVLSDGHFIAKTILLPS
jgi:hypothetical protein